MRENFSEQRRSCGERGRWTSGEWSNYPRPVTCSRLATTLDTERLATVPVHAAPFDTRDEDLDRWTGVEVAQHLGDRLLLRYIVPAQIGAFTSGDPGSHYVTPTPYAPADAIIWLALPAPGIPREHALVLRPELIDLILGPRTVRWGGGIEYILPRGFPQAALHFPWEIRIS